VAGATPLLPVTKVGPGDKEKAYVVRQNCMLKFLLLCVCFVSVFTTVLVYMRYEVHVQRRQAVEGAREHREEEHASHMRVMRLSVLLQRHLEDEVHDVAVLTSYRAWLMRAVGDYQRRVVEHSSNCSAALREELQAEGISFDAEIERLLKLLWDDVVKEGKAAQRSLHNITHAIISELRDEASEQGEYERVMAEAGEDPGLLGYHKHEVEYHAGHGHPHHRDGHDGDEHARHPGAPDDPYHPYGDEHHGDEHHGGDEHGDAHMHHDGDDDDEEHLAGALEALLARLQHNDSVVVGLSNETIEQWGELRESSLRALSDSEQEVDMTRLEAKIVRAMNASAPVAPLPAYNESEHGSRLDYLGELIHRAKLAPYRDELLGLLSAWQAGDTRISTPLNRIEELIESDILDPDVLYMRSDYEQYRYDD